MGAVVAQQTMGICTTARGRATRVLQRPGTALAELRRTTPNLQNQLQKSTQSARPLKRQKDLEPLGPEDAHSNGQEEPEPEPHKAKSVETEKAPSETREAANENETKQMVNKQRRGQVRLNLWQLPADFEGDELMEIASDYGAVLSHEFWQEKKQMCAMVEYETRDQAMAALEALHNRKMDGWHMLLKALVCD